MDAILCFHSVCLQCGKPIEPSRNYWCLDCVEALVKRLVELEAKVTELTNSLHSKVQTELALRERLGDPALWVPVERPSEAAGEGE